MENSFNKGVRDVKKNLQYIFLIILGVAVLNFLFKAALNIGILLLLGFGIYKLWEGSKKRFKNFKFKREKLNREKEINNLKENIGNTTYMEAEILKSNLEKSKNQSFNYVDVEYDEVK
ncbi:hypothetical protein HAHI6034_10190 [Hathewaya histolytica]|uniref:Uncharacterized protein n=1 Tax=Hathewaya histolytica TaxID=1498 RepID=A0A4U9RCP7_HATHI|nr:hypothetical protein [Hathewaya histolytica]VTQ86460.1 Uncharacterised protein [Hathewaya histolytica]